MFIWDSNGGDDYVDDNSVNILPSNYLSVGEAGLVL